MSPYEQIISNPFLTAGEANRRIKMLLWGDSGSGKTTTALQFPSPVRGELNPCIRSFSMNIEREAKPVVI